MRARTHHADLRQPRRKPRAAVRPDAGMVRIESVDRGSERGAAASSGAMILGLALKSLRNRRFTAALTVLSIALAVALLLGVERLRQESRESFGSSVSGTDLIVG